MEEKNQQLGSGIVSTFVTSCKAPISFVMSVGPSICKNQRRSNRKNFREYWFYYVCV